MTFSINNQNTLNIQVPFSVNYKNKINIRIPFPPSISVDEIVQLHIKNGIKNVNQTMNPFMIYRKEYNHIVTKFNLKPKDISLNASISWKQEPQNVKNHYKQLAKRVKELFKEKVPSLFIPSKQESSTKDNNVSLGTFPSPTLNGQNSSPYVTESNYSPLDMKTLVFDNFEDHLCAYMTMNDDEFMEKLPGELALTYRAINQSLPFKW